MRGGSAAGLGQSPRGLCLVWSPPMLLLSSHMGRRRGLSGGPCPLLRGSSQGRAKAPDPVPQLGPAWGCWRPPCRAAGCPPPRVKDSAGLLWTPASFLSDTLQGPARGSRDTQAQPGERHPMAWGWEEACQRGQELPPHLRSWVGSDEPFWEGVGASARVRFWAPGGECCGAPARMPPTARFLRPWPPPFSLPPPRHQELTPRC